MNPVCGSIHMAMLAVPGAKATQGPRCSMSHWRQWNTKLCLDSAATTGAMRAVGVLQEQSAEQYIVLFCINRHVRMDHHLNISCRVYDM